MFQWMFFEQYSHEPFIATSRFWLQHKPDSPEKTALLASKRDGGWAALKIMEEHLAKNDFFVGDYSIADIALFAYTHVAHEGGFPLDDFPKIRAWIRTGDGAAGIYHNGVNPIVQTARLRAMILRLPKTSSFPVSSRRRDDFGLTSR